MDDCSRAVTLSFRCTQGSGFQVQAGRENVPEPSAVTRGVSHPAEAAWALPTGRVPPRGTVWVAGPRGAGLAGKKPQALRRSSADRGTRADGHRGPRFAAHPRPRLRTRELPSGNAPRRSTQFAVFINRDQL